MSTNRKTTTSRIERNLQLGLSGSTRRPTHIPKRREQNNLGERKMEQKASVKIETEELVQPKPRKKRFEYERPLIDCRGNNWVTLQLKMVTWSHLQFSIQVCVETPVEMVRKYVIDHHNGTISNVVLYKDKVAQKNEIVAQEAETLLHHGIEGGKKEERVEQIIYYDFQEFETGKKGAEILNADSAILNYIPQRSTRSDR